MLTEINTYIDTYVLHSKVWDGATDTVKQKAINNSQRILKTMLPNQYPDTIPTEHIAEQCLWMLKIDDSMQRAELGVTYISIDGISMNISEKDRSVAPYIQRALGLTKRRVGRYS